MFNWIRNLLNNKWIQIHDDTNQAVNYPLVLNPNGGNVGIGTANPTNGVLEVTGQVYFSANCSALSFTDRTPYPKDLKEAYDSILSMQRNIVTGGVDHKKLNDFIKGKLTKKSIDETTKEEITITEYSGRNLSATVSALNEVVKDLILKIKTLEEKKV